MKKESFRQWLIQERERQGWSQSDLARAAQLKRGVIHKTEHGMTRPRLATFLALSRALGYSPLFLLRKAGLLPPVTGNPIDFEDWKFMLEQLTKAELAEVREIVVKKIRSHN